MFTYTPRTRKRNPLNNIYNHFKKKCCRIRVERSFRVFFYNLLVFPPNIGIENNLFPFLIVYLRDINHHAWLHFRRGFFGKLTPKCINKIYFIQHILLNAQYINYLKSFFKRTHPKPPPPPPQTHTHTTLISNGTSLTKKYIKVALMS